MWELDYKESWEKKNWCFWTVVLEKTLESLQGDPTSPLIFLKEISPEYSLEAKAETPILWLPDEKYWLTGKDPDARQDWRQEEKGTTEDETVGWHHWLDGQGLGVGDGQESLVCCSPWGRKESDTTEWLSQSLNWRGHEPASEQPLEARKGKKTDFP